LGSTSARLGALAFDQRLALDHFQLRELHQDGGYAVRVRGEIGALRARSSRPAAHQMQLPGRIPDGDFGDVA